MIFFHQYHHVVNWSKLGVLLLILVSLFTVIVIRLVDIQIIKGAVFRQLADNNRFFTLRIPPERGIFFDRYQEPLVWNKRSYFSSDPQVINSLSRKIEPAEALRLMATSSAKVSYGLQRQYQYAQSLASVLGYVGPVTVEELLHDNSLVVSDMTGKLGLENVYDTQLRGQAGSTVYEINALGQRQRVVSEKSGTAGHNITTTLDPYLSEISLNALDGFNGAIVILDAKTGSVLSLVSTPTFDANMMSLKYVDDALEQQRKQQVSLLFKSDNQPFFNRVLSGTYPPGSIFKIVTSWAGLERGVLDENTIIVDDGTLQVGAYEYANWYFTTYGKTEGKLSIKKAIARSNDIFFYKVAELLGPDQLASFARLLGLGKPTGIQFKGEARGLIPDPAWKEKNIGEPWYLGNTFHMGIGQGDVLVTPLQIAQLIQAVANNGTMCSPSLINDEVNCMEVGASSKYLKLILEGMLNACSSGGTAFPFFEYNAAFINADEFNGAKQQLSVDDLIKSGAVACKTGTAEFGAADEKGYRKTHGWFTAIIGTEKIKTTLDTKTAVTENYGDNKDKTTNNETINPVNYQHWQQAVKKYGFPDKLVLVALVESDQENSFKEGSGDAAPVVKKIIDWLYGK